LCKEKDEIVDHLVRRRARLHKETTESATTKSQPCCTETCARNTALQQAKTGGNTRLKKCIRIAKILWNFKIQTDKHLVHNIPDITEVEH
jgi:hypothetical protein